MMTKLYKQANILWKSYLMEKDVKKATGILLQWQAKMAKIHAIQDQLIDLFTNELQNDADQSYLSQDLPMDQGSQQEWLVFIDA